MESFLLRAYCSGPNPSIASTPNGPGASLRCWPTQGVRASQEGRSTAGRFNGPRSQLVGTWVDSKSGGGLHEPGTGTMLLGSEEPARKLWRDGLKNLRRIATAHLAQVAFVQIPPPPHKKEERKKIKTNPEINPHSLFNHSIASKVQSALPFSRFGKPWRWDVRGGCRELSRPVGQLRWRL